MTKPMRKKLLRGLFFLLATSSIGTSYAQKSMINFLEPEGFTLGASVGLTDLWGDVGTQSILYHYGNSHYWENVRGMAGVYGSYAFHPSINARLSVNHGMLYASDKFNKDLAQKAPNMEDDAYQRYMRNQTVKTVLWESSLMFEFTPLRMNIDGDAALRRMQPYILAGIGAYHYKAKGLHKSREGYDLGWLELDQFNVEGHGWDFKGAPQEKISNWQMNVPLGLGLKWDLSREIGIGVEYIYRYCFTDYLDNVSGQYVSPEFYNAKFDQYKAQTASDLQDMSWEVRGDKSFYNDPGTNRGNPNVKDAYSSLNFRIYWKINRKYNPWW